MRVRGAALRRSRPVRVRGPWSPIVVAETYQGFRDAQLRGAVSDHSRFMPLSSVWRLRHIHEQVSVLHADGMCERWPAACRELLARGDQTQWLEA